MALKPVLTNINAFDATQGTTFYFSWKGAQARYNELIIKDSETNFIVYQHKTETLKLSHTMDLALGAQNANVTADFVNGRQYQATVSVYDFTGAKLGDTSSPITFWCYRAPKLIITNNDIINNTVTMSSLYVTLELQYDEQIPSNEHLEEYDTLREYSVSLYDSGHVLLSNSGSLTPDEMIYRIEGLTDETSYSVRATGVTLHGLPMDTGFFDFTVVYPSKGVGASVVAKNMGDGTIRISTNFKITNAIANPDPPVYVNEKEIDLTGEDAYVEFVDGVDIPSNFELKARLRNMKENAFILLTTETEQRLWIGYKVFYTDVAMTKKKYYFKVRSDITLENIVYSKMFDEPAADQYTILVVTYQNGYFSVNVKLE